MPNDNGGHKPKVLQSHLPSEMRTMASHGARQLAMIGRNGGSLGWMHGQGSGIVRDHRHRCSRPFGGSGAAQLLLRTPTMGA